MDFVRKVQLFNAIAGTKEEFNQRKAAMYVGLILEEVAEMIESFKNESCEGRVKEFNEIAMKFKSGELDYLLDNVDRVEFLDAAVDIAVVALGAGISIGGDIDKACNKVADNNLEKFPLVNGVHTVLKDENGKVRKPEGYKSVNLEDCIHYISKAKE
jgi:hypothetical protein